MTRHIAIIGAGRVGSTIAYTLAVEGLVEKISLVDINKTRAEGEALDLQDGLAFLRPVSIHSGDYSLCRDAQIIVITAGASQQPGQDRMELLEQNAAIFQKIIPSITDQTREAIIIVVTNPVDVLTYLTIKLAGLPKGRVLGSGTVLDTARLRNQISQHCHIDPHNIHAYVIGEHGETAVPVWSAAQIAGLKLEQFCHYCGKGCSARTEIGQRAMSAADAIINRKGATYYSISLAVSRIVQSILRNEHSVLTVSTLVQGYYGINENCLSLPAIINSGGAKETLPLGLEDEELRALKQSAARLQKAQQQIYMPLEPVITG